MCDGFGAAANVIEIRNCAWPYDPKSVESLRREIDEAGRIWCRRHEKNVLRLDECPATLKRIVEFAHHCS
jgi:hypothetical protein